ncbi:MAG: GNAT family N-acetyltransferase [Atopobiaceae bacterium]|nr:GNAT family N-acetyltransferase [Atopobiaceae bacterium]MCI2172964.1 GNAT family N-acetyltransferase [Atopobiaceae bacterium]MCI2208369.1 GNAT family N-acetyltransferase [Atopobiaceae bacterium]
MIQTREIPFDEVETIAADLGITLPIEQTHAWMDYEATIPGRTPWGAVALERDGATLAVAAFADYETHGYHFLRSHHGPAWATVPTEVDEREAMEAILSYVRSKDPRIAFIRLSVMADLDICRPTLSSIPYDHTVIIDLAGGADEIMSRMKPRGRRDVRKALRESPAECADETEEASASFEEYYDVMRETGERDGFVPAPISDYEDMLRILGPDHARVFAGRVDGRVVTWSIVTIYGGRAVRYYGASRNDTMRSHVTDKLVYTECDELSRRGCADYDMMAIGSDFSPKLMGLNEFKTKFTKEVTEVAPDRDLPVKSGFYGILAKAKSVVQARRDAAEKAADKARREAPRDDLVPVILGGDIGTYALGREFHEAYHVKSICVSSGAIGAIRHSSIFRIEQVGSFAADEVLACVRRIAEASPESHVVLMANTDRLIEVLETIHEDLPENVVCPLPNREVFDLMSDKMTFSELCRGHGLDTPETELVRLGQPGKVAPSAIGFPCVAKPSCSADYAPFLNKGFKKVYYVHDQAQLDDLWRRLVEAGFLGDFLVQELIEGDDTYMDSMTIYMGSDGKAHMLGAAQVLLEDHAPTMLGNPVAMIVRPMPELWEKAEALLADAGYRGFANFDIKRDPKTGRTLFLEVNPRIGRNSYYNCAAGVNPMRALVTDAVDGKGGRCFKADDHVLYTLVPTDLLKTYVRDPELAAEVETLIAEGHVADPQRYDADKGPRRMIDVELTERNQVRKFAQYYPKPTETSF